jgi:hypothetical protein
VAHTRRVPITGLLEELRLAFLERGCDVDRHLKPGLSREEILERTQSLGLRVPDDLIEMYEWRNGQAEDAEMSPDALMFRDNKFVDLDDALREYPLIQEYYEPEPDSIPLGFELREVFPFAAYMSASYVVVCGSHTLPSPYPNPVVSVFEGIDVFFLSLETMLRTCVEWTRHPSWERPSGLPEEIESEIWHRLNPGIFAS